MNAYTLAKERYAALGVDTEAVLETLKNVTVSVHCWQGDDVVGFDAKEALSGGIQTTGNYPGKATTPEQLMADFDEVLRLTPGKKKLNLHASYAIFKAGEFADRDAIQPKHFSRWVAYAKERGLGIDFNPTFFSHSMVKDGLTLSSPDEAIRKFWVEHGKRCMAIAEYFAEETGKPCVINFWIPDGYKDYPADRLSPRRRYAQSMDEILSVPYDKTKVFPCIESKVFGIGLEAYTVGSAEFCTNYVNTRRITPLMDNGHYHPTELVSDKISSMLLFNDRLALHITRPMRWDSDHVVLFDDETREMMKEIVDRGHSIGIHTMSHVYERIYASPEAYFADLLGMQDVIYQNTGVKTTLMRFPGGSSNTVSAHSYVGLMSLLTRAVQDAGFQYFDWNVDSNDAGGAKKAQTVFNNVTEGVSHNRVSVVLQHDIHDFSVDAVEDIIVWGLNNGYSFERLTENSPGVHHGVQN